MTPAQAHRFARASKREGDRWERTLRLGGRAALNVDAVLHARQRVTHRAWLQLSPAARHAIQAPMIQEVKP